MRRHTLIISLAVLVLNFQAFGAAWYIENFNKFKNGDIVGQDDWEIAMNQKTSQIQSKVKHGDVGKSVLVSEKTMVLRKFKGSNASIQYVSLFARKDDGPGPLMIYIGGDAVKWGAAAKIDIKAGGIITANKGNAAFPEVLKGKFMNLFANNQGEYWFLILKRKAMTSTLMGKKLSMALDSEVKEVKVVSTQL